MSILLVILALALSLALWLSIMYAWWQEERGIQSPEASALAENYFARCVRLSRRGWYACTMYARSIGAWGTEKMQKVFFSLFPSAKPAFAKHDELAGLTHGPTSYFLRSISEKETAPVKRSRKIFS